MWVVCSLAFFPPLPSASGRLGQMGRSVGPSLPPGGREWQGDRTHPLTASVTVPSPLFPSLLSSAYFLHLLSFLFSHLSIQGRWVSPWAPLNFSSINGGDKSTAACFPGLSEDEWMMEVGGGTVDLCGSDFVYRGPLVNDGISVTPVCSPSLQVALG